MDFGRAEICVYLLKHLLVDLCEQVFVGMQTIYILWTWLIEGRPRATIAALFMFTFRGILGYSTQLPLPQVNRTNKL